MSEDHDEKEHKHCPFCGHHVDEDDMISDSSPDTDGDIDDSSNTE